MSNKISHPGVIDRIEGDCVKVRIIQTSACAACKVASHCNASESKEKLVDVFGCDTAKYSTGQEVVVSASKEVANRALLLGFGIPLLLMVAVLLIVLRWTGDEGIAALASLGALIPYYILLWLLRDSIRQQVSFRIEE
ncbi:MAG: SoxR reducing system RseC family protein [Prevotella sp.]|jgi:sigma-E factor negative regulatory protein RseC|nr:SoxR reducing system RseC family protein [Prevotella sp.]